MRANRAQVDGMDVQPDEHMYKPGRRGLLHSVDAFSYSMKGIRAAWQNEAAFRQLAILGCILIPASFWLAPSVLHQSLMIASCLLVLMCEMLNSAVEAVVDRVSTELHPLSGRAKDLGSAATFFSMMIVLTIWIPALWQKFSA